MGSGVAGSGVVGVGPGSGVVGVGPGCRVVGSR